MKLKNTKLIKAMWGNRYLYAAGALLPLMASMTSTAAEVNKNSETENEVEVISVTGTRGSLINARNMKEGSEQISDSYFAEDIGKSADETIGAAMQRIPGISIDANPTGNGAEGEQGKGTVVSVRGMRPELNQVFINGIPLTSGLSSQAVDLSIISADVLSQIEVIKSARAKDEEGSLVGNIYLSSIAPLAQGESKTIISAETRHNDLSGSTTPRFVVSTVQQSDDDKFGFAGSFFYDPNDNVESDQFESWDWARSSKISGGRSQETGNFLDQSQGLAVGDIMTEADAEKYVESITYFSTRYNDYVYDETKMGGNITLQYQPDDDTDIRFDAMYSSQSLDSTLNFFSPGAPGGSVGEGKLAGYTFIDARGDIAEWYDPVSMSSMSAATSESDGNVDTLALGLDFTTVVGDWELHGKVSHSDSLRKNHLQDIVFANNLPKGVSYQEQVEALIASGVDMSDPRQHCGAYIAKGAEVNLPVGQGCAANDPYNSFSGFRVRQFKDNYSEMNDSKQAAYFDASNLSLELGPITAVHVGVKYTDRAKVGKKDLGSYAFPQDGGASYLAPNDPRFTLNNVGTGFLGGIGPDELSRGWMVPDRQELFDFFSDEKATSLDVSPHKPSNWEVTEKTYGAYLQFDFESGALSGDFGVRYAHTEVAGESSGSMSFHPDASFNGTPYADLHPDAILSGTKVEFPLDSYTETNSYDNFLPSLNLRYEFSDDLLLRASASQTLARPPMSSLVPGVSVSAVSNPTGRIGSTSLDPFTSTNFDLSLEWYFNETGVLSAAYYQKSIDTFAYKTVVEQEFPNLLTGEPCMVDRETALSQAGEAASYAATVAEWGCMDVKFNTELNDATADISGYELGYTQMYDFLPGALQYLGFTANYTYADSEQDLNPEEEDLVRDGMNFENTSKHTLNATLFWENEDFSARLAYNHRSPSVKRAKSFAGTMVYTDTRSTLAFAANYDVNEQLQVTFSVSDLLDSYTRNYMVPQSQGNIDIDKVSDHLTSSIYHGGRTIRAGVRYTF